MSPRYEGKPTATTRRAVPAPIRTNHHSLGGHPMTRPNAAAQGRRHAVLAATLAGASVGEAAALAGVRRETASRYLSEPAVAALLATERNALAEQTRHAVHALHHEAVRIVLHDLRTGQNPERALAVLRLTLRGGLPEDRSDHDAAQLTDELTHGAHDAVLDALLDDLTSRR